MANRPEVQNSVDHTGRKISLKGMSRLIREHKRVEAQERNARTKPDNRRAHWKAQGFSRKSHAARVVATTVREANAIADDIREKSGLTDWAPLPDAVR